MCTQGQPVASGQFTLSWSEPFSELTSDISALEMIVSGSAGVSMYARGCLSLSIKCVLYFFVGGVEEVVLPLC